MTNKLTEDGILKLVQSRGMVTVSQVGTYFDVDRRTARGWVDKLFRARRLRKVSIDAGRRPAVYALPEDGKPVAVARHNGVSLPCAPWDTDRYEVAR